jgi:hypothetical protein
MYQTYIFMCKTSWHILLVELKKEGEVGCDFVKIAHFLRDREVRSRAQIRDMRGYNSVIRISERSVRAALL